LFKKSSQFSVKSTKALIVERRASSPGQRNS
jgi:hypothetical protein